MFIYFFMKTAVKSQLKVVSADRPMTRLILKALGGGFLIFF